MSGMQRRKGATTEVQVVNWLRNRGHPHAERAPNGRAQPRHGDVLGFPGLSIEIKNQRTVDLAGWVDQAEQQADGLPFFVIHKRPRVIDPGAWYVITTLAQWELILRSAGLLTPTQEASLR